LRDSRFLRLCGSIRACAVSGLVGCVWGCLGAILAVVAGAGGAIDRAAVNTMPQAALWRRRWSLGWTRNRFGTNSSTEFEEVLARCANVEYAFPSPLLFLDLAKRGRETQGAKLQFICPL